VASYSLRGSYSTVQVLSPTLINPVVYCTISTVPSGVIAAMPIQEDVFNAGGGGPELTAFGNAIEQIMADPRVVAGVGEQTIEQSGLLADSVVFTVQYVSANTAPSGVTADAVVPVASLNFEDAEIGRVLLGSVEQIIGGVYDNLAATAGG
jgi:hypothetical protein